VDLIAASFIRQPKDVLEIRNILGEKGKDIKIISKIESTEGLENVKAILDVSDGIMVAR
jgi:pyruvate kinase